VAQCSSDRRGDERKLSEDVNFVGLEGLTVPMFRAVDAHTGEVAPVPTYMASAMVLLEEMKAQRDRAIRERDDAVAERDNMVNLGKEVGRLSDYLQHAIADRDDYRDQVDEWRDKYDGAQCRMDEMAAEAKEKCDRYLATIDEVQSENLTLQTDLSIARSERDTAVARAALQ
jgi:hypothetical protein